MCNKRSFHLEEILGGLLLENIEGLGQATAEMHVVVKILLETDKCLPDLPWIVRIILQAFQHHAEQIKLSQITKGDEHLAWKL